MLMPDSAPTHDMLAYERAGARTPHLTPVLTATHSRVYYQRYFFSAPACVELLYCSTCRGDVGRGWIVGRRERFLPPPDRLELSMRLTLRPV